VTESRFRERRSAFRDESAGEAGTAAPVAPSAEPVAAEAGTAEPRAPDPAEAPIREAGPSEAQLAPPGVGPDLDGVDGMQIPEPSFLELVEEHYARALGCLGQLPLNPEGERQVLPELAKHEIDLLGILEQRTRGNLPPEEKQFLDQVLDQLRTLYLRVAR
jgi:hypothetical protein